MDKLQGSKFLGGTIDIKYANERKRDPPNSQNRRSSRSPSPSPSPPRRVPADRDFNRNERDRDQNRNDRDRDRSPRNGGGNGGPQRRQREKERPPVKRHEPYSKSPRADKAQMNKRPMHSGVNNMINDLASMLKQQVQGSVPLFSSFSNSCINASAI